MATSSFDKDVTISEINYNSLKNIVTRSKPKSIDLSNIRGIPIASKADIKKMIK